MKTAEETLKQEYEEMFGTQKYKKSQLYHSFEGVAKNAMIKFSAQEKQATAISFGGLLRFATPSENTDDQWHVDRNPFGIKGGYYTTYQLYTLYISSLK